MRHESSLRQSLVGSFRKSRTGLSPDRRSCATTASKALSCSKKSFKGLREYSKMVLDIKIFSNSLEDWVLERMPHTSTNKKILFKSPFLIDDLCKLDYALEGVLFQQLLRMPCTRQASDMCKEEQFLALEDFLQTAIEGLWHTFWHKTGPIPFLVSCPCYPTSKFYTVEKAISSGRLGELCGAAVLAKDETNLHGQWDHVLQLALFKSDIAHENGVGFSALTICEALFYGFHILLSRSLNKHSAVDSNLTYLLVLDSKFGGVVKFGGDLSKLKTDSCNPYHSLVEWIKHHAEVNVSPIDRIWNKLGNANWGDVGTLQLLLATYNSIVQWKGPPRKSIASLAADHSLRLQKRRMGCSGVVQHNIHNNQEREIEELDCSEDLFSKEQASYVNFKKGEVVLLEDSQGQKGFQIKEIRHCGNCLSYTATSLDHPTRLFMIYVGVHSSRLEQSWEAMSMWYVVQRQTKVLNIMKQKGLSSKYLPEIVASGQIVHPGPCTKMSTNEHCDHPCCGTPILVIHPVGKTLSSIIDREGPLSSEEALRCCRDILTALSSVAQANIQHGDIHPENIVRVDSLSTRTGAFYVLTSWGRAVLDDRDSPALNLQFSSICALQHRKLCPSSDVESLIYVLYFVCGGRTQGQDSIESALQWRERCWAKRMIQQWLGEVSALLKALADYVDNLCGTPYPVDYDIWLRRLNRILVGSDRGKSAEVLEVSPRLDHFAESSRTSGSVASFLY